MVQTIRVTDSRSSDDGSPMKDLSYALYLLCTLAWFLLLLLAFIQSSIVASIVPRHQQVFEIFVVNCMRIPRQPGSYVYHENSSMSYLDQLTVVVVLELLKMKSPIWPLLVRVCYQSKDA